MDSIGRRIRLALKRTRTVLRPDIKVVDPPSDVLVTWNVPIVVRDGTTLRANVFRPQGTGRVPVIMSVHPYGKDRIPAKTPSGRGLNFQYRMFPQPESIRFSRWTSWEAPDPAVWVPRGYAVVNVDMRGAGESEGIGELMSEQEAEDYYDAIEWAGTQPWSSGKVGLDGVSYLAISQYGVAALQPPHLAAICPWEGFSDLYRDFARPGGVREDGFTILWTKGVKALGRFPVSIRDEVVARAELDDWYRSRQPRLEEIRTPMLVCASFSDQSLHTRGSFELFRRAGSSQKWVYTHRGGKWSTYYSQAATEVRARFFDHFLKDADNGWPREPRVRLAVHDEGPVAVAVTGESAWPPEDTRWRKLWLNAGEGSLDAGAIPSTLATSSFDLPRGVTRFQWVVPMDMDIVGPMVVKVYVEVSGTDDVFLFAGLRKFRGDEELTFEGSFGFSGDMITKGWQRAAHRTLDPKLSLPHLPVHLHSEVEPLQPGEVVPVEIAMLPQATRLRRGDVLVLQISGRWFFPRNPLSGQFPTFYQRSGKGRCLLHAGGRFDAHLLVGVRSPSETCESGSAGGTWTT